MSTLDMTSDRASKDGEERESKIVACNSNSVLGTRPVNMSFPGQPGDDGFMSEVLRTLHMTDLARPQFERLWPTLLMTLALPGADQANAVLAPMLLAEDTGTEDLTVRYLDQDIFGQSHPAIGWLRQCCHKAVLDYAAELNMSYRPEFDIQGWANINRRGDYHNLHNHPHSWLSGTYYVQVPNQSQASRNRSDLNPGEISFFDPRPQANMNAVRDDGQFNPEYRRLPMPGELFLWPSFLHHLVHPNLVDEPRVSISFNVVLKRKVL